MTTPSRRRREGREAFEDGQSLRDNPYNVDGYGKDWAEGFEAARQSNQKQVEKDQACKSWPYGMMLSDIETVGELYEHLKTIEANHAGE